MKKLLLVFVFVISATMSKAQASCNQSAFNPTQIIATGTSTSLVNVSTALLYICPNSFVGDSSSIQTCRWVIVNSGSYYAFRQKPCGSNFIYAKANSTVNILPASSGSTLNIYQEPGASIINNSTLTINTTTCSVIATPSAVNCSSTSAVADLTMLNNKIEIYPNPASDKITIQALWGNSFNEAAVSITNLLGSLVYDKKSIGGQKLEIDLKDLQSGVYYLSVNSATVRETRKIIISK